MKKRVLSLLLLLSVMIFSYDYKELLVGDTKGNLYVQDNIYEPRPMASITKVMTILLTLDKVNAGEIKMDEGDFYTVEELLKVTAIRSSNNAAYTLTEYVSHGDVDQFVSSMNKKAEKMGLTTIVYCTPHGLPPGDTGTCMDRGSAYDIYKLALEAIKYPEYMKIAGKNGDYIKDGQVKLVPTNNLLGRVEGVDGLKTGYHKAAGSNIVLTAERNGLRVITVIMGSEKAKNRDILGEEEINYFFANYKKQKIISDDKSVLKVKIKGKDYELYPDENIEDIININNFNESDVVYKFDVKKSYVGTPKKGEVLGEYTATYNGNEYTGKLKYK